MNADDQLLLSLPRRGRVAVRRTAGWGFMHENDPTRLATLATLPFQGRDGASGAHGANQSNPV
jgi:hypothetical protein